jgi:pilus assembly protein CpaC
MKLPIITLALAAGLAAPTASAQPGTPTAAVSPGRGQVLRQQTDDLTLSVGESRTLSAAGVASYSEGVPGVADVRLTPDEGQFVIVGKNPGATTLLLIRRDGTQHRFAVSVFSRPVEQVEDEVAALLDGTPGVRLRRVGARFFIEGGVGSEPELQRIEHIASLFPGQVESLVVLGGAAADRKTNVRVDFFFIQLDRSKSYGVGVKYPTGLSAPVVTASYDVLAGAFARATAVVTQPLPGLDLAASRGWAKVLKHSTVISSNGSEARFSSGGEQSYIITSGLSAALTPLPFGTNVSVLPRFDPATRELEVRVDAEVSDLTAAVAPGTDLPGRTVSKLSTLVSLELGQSIVLSGIRTRSQRHSVSGLPLLADIPVLGVLFGSHGDVREELEGAIVVVPSVVESVPKSAREALDDALRQYDAYEGDLGAASSGSSPVAPSAPARPSAPAAPAAPGAPATPGAPARPSAPAAPVAPR